MNLYYEHLETLTANKAATSHDSQTNNRSNHSQMLFKIGVLKNFANFRPATLLKRDSNTGVFPRYMQNF